jgi:magnesium chelatase subunit H
MTPKRTSAVSPQAAAGAGVPGQAETHLRVVFVTMDNHLASAMDRARRRLAKLLPGVTVSLHAACEWAAKPPSLARCREEIAQADIVVATMLFMEDHFLPVLDALQARREQCDAMLCAMCASEVTRLTRLGRFDMSKPASAPLALLKRLRGQKGTPTQGGEKQMKMLRRLPQLLRFIPGTAQDVRAYFLALQYWLGGSEDNVLQLVLSLVDRYAAGPREVFRGRAKVLPPVLYPDVGLYHPKLPERITEVLANLPSAVPASQRKGRVGLLLLRSYLLSGNARHYDGVIAALEVQGLQVVPAFAAGLDARPAIERYFMHDGRPAVDAVVSLTGFSLVGGPAYNDAAAAQAVLKQLDVPYVAAHPVEFQTLPQWGDSARGLLPVEATVMVAIPELEGATGTMLFSGRSGGAGATCGGCDKRCTFGAEELEQDMHACSERTAMLAGRVARLVALRKSERAQRRVAIVIFNFPPNAGHVGTAAFLGVFESVFASLQRLKAEGYTVDVPESALALQQRLLKGNAEQFGTDANVLVRISTDDHVRRERHLREIEAQWGPAPGKQLANGREIFVLGVQCGNVALVVQPGMGYEGDPMRLLFERGFAPTHAFSAFYRWLREDFRAHAVLHFGTHGALEFMPGKQAGLSGACWPERLIGELPNFYLYAANNPSEGTIAKRRSAATLISYMTPPLAQAGLYKGLAELRGSLQRWRGLAPEAWVERQALLELLQAQAVALELTTAEPVWASAEPALQDAMAAELVLRLSELEHTLIPYGLHVVGRVMPAEHRLQMLTAVAEAALPGQLGPEGQVASRELIEAAHAGQAPAGWEKLGTLAAELARDSELPALVHALDGRYVPPSPSGDLLTTPEVLPTGRNLHGFDPFRLPSTFAQREGERLAQLLLARHQQEGNALPRSVALVLWGTDNLKSEGAPIAQALALMGARPRLDGYGRLAGAELRPLSELGRPRIDVIITISGIFRDLLPLQIKLLAEAAFLAACAEEPEEQNFVRAHALAWQSEHGGTLETAALRVFGNAEGAYGSNVNHLLENARWEDEDELAEAYTRRKGFAYGRGGRPQQQAALLESVLAQAELAYQNLDSVELGVTTVDTYFDTLGGISRAMRRAQGGHAAPVYIADATRGRGTVRTLSEQVSLEARTRMLNPKWVDGLLEHGFEGVRQIESHLTNTMGWSATTGQVQPWVYQQVTETFLLDPAMRERLAALNPTASVKLAQRLLEAGQRRYWSPSDETLAALQAAGDELEDRLEGIYDPPAAAPDIAAPATLKPLKKAAA